MVLVGRWGADCDAHGLCCRYVGVGSVLAVPVPGLRSRSLEPSPRPGVWLFKVLGVEPAPPQTRSGALVPLRVDPSTTEVRFVVGVPLIGKALTGQGWL